MISVSVEADIRKATAYLNSLERDQVPFATSVALNRTAVVAKKQVVLEMKRVFDRPTPYTLDALYVKPSTKHKLIVVLGIKNEAYKAAPALKWLAPQIDGGARRAKGMEARMRAVGVLGAGQFAVPASGAKLDAYGNMSRGQIVAILSDVGAQRDPTANSTRESRAKRARRRKRGGVYFALKYPRGKLQPGVYERIATGFGSAVRPVLIFTSSAPTYRKRLAWDKIIVQTVQQRFPFEFKRALIEALRTGGLGPRVVRAAAE